MTDSDDTQGGSEPARSAVWRRVRLVAVTIVGGILTLAGLAMLVLPGPGLLALIAGLAILASEYAWARRHLDRAKRAAQKAKDKVTKRPDPDADPSPPKRS